MAVDERAARRARPRVGGHGAALPRRRPRPSSARRRTTSRPAGLRDLLWQPTELYPPEVLDRSPVGAGRRLRGRGDGELAAAGLPRDSRRKVRVPVEFSVADHESVWESDPEALAAIAALFTAVTPRGRSTKWPDSGHNLSVGLQRRRLPPSECCRSSRNASPPRRAATTKPVKSEARRDARRIHRAGQSGRADGAPDRRGRLRTHAVGARPASVEPYADTAAKVAATPAELGAASDLVCLCVVGDDDVRQVLRRRDRCAGGTGAGRHRRHPQHRSPRHLPRDRGSRCETGVSVIDAPVSGGAPAVEAGHADGDGRRRGGRRRDVPAGVRDVLRRRSSTSVRLAAARSPRS